MARSKFPTLLSLLLALVMGSAPWRQCQAEGGDHGRIWLPHGACGAAVPETCCRHAAEISPVAARSPVSVQPQGHLGHEDSDAPAHPNGHCHCTDGSLIAGLAIALVSLESPCFAGWWASSGAASGDRTGARASSDVRERPRICPLEVSAVLLQ